MDINTFIRSCELGRRNNYEIYIGGGEPTLHPDLWEFISIVITMGYDIRITTNGKIPKRAFRLAELAKQGYLHAILSLDQFHEPIDRRVVTAFKSIHKNPNDKRHIINYISQSELYDIGRAKQNNLGGKFNAIIDEILIDPSGYMYKNAPLDHIIGNINTIGGEE